MFPTQAFRSTTQRKILRVLAEKNKRYTVAELAEMCQRSEASISRALDHTDRYPFLERDNISGSKKLTVRLDPGSPYTAPIKEFFATERNRERVNGTVPVQIWNLLEDIVVASEQKRDDIIDIWLYGSYATGDYYAGSDIDLMFLIRSQDSKPDTRIQDIIDETVPEHQEVHTVMVTVSDTGDHEQMREQIRQQSPIDDRGTAMSLLGEVETV